MRSKYYNFGSTPDWIQDTYQYPDILDIIEQEEKAKKARRCKRTTGFKPSRDRSNIRARLGAGAFVSKEEAAYYRCTCTPFELAELERFCALHDYIGITSLFSSSDRGLNRGYSEGYTSTVLEMNGRSSLVMMPTATPDINIDEDSAEKVHTVLDVLQNNLHEDFGEALRFLAQTCPTDITEALGITDALSVEFEGCYVKRVESSWEQRLDDFKVDVIVSADFSLKIPAEHYCGDKTMTGDATYGQITIRNAVSSCAEIYRPVAGLPDEDDILLDFTDLDADTIQEERDRREKDGYTFTPDYRYLSTTIEELSPHTNPRYESFQIGNGRMFVDFFRSIILMNDTRGRWYIYDGRVWRPDQHDIKIAEMAKDFRDALLAFAPSITSEDTRNRYLKRVDALDQRKYRDLMVKDAASDPTVTVDMSAFDRDKFLFNCHNGTINLITGEFRPHDPKDMLTKMTEVDYVPDAVCERWLTFMDEVMEGDKERIKYLQKAIGYAMSGDTRLECMFILYGATSRNGKGTTMETVLRILGEYGRTAKPDMLSKKGFADSSGPSEDVARLNGARMVNVSEPGKSMQIDASLTKQMTGNNILTARFLRENSFEFKPQFKLFIDTNHLPQISDMTLFESDRIKIIPFNRHFTAEERDIDLKSFFAKPENLSGILNWCLEGFRLYMAEGLDMPDSVEEATTQYRQQSDRIMMFTSQCVKKERGQELRAQAVYSRYKDWCAENGFKYENASNFRKKMEQAGYVYQRRRPWNEKGAEKTSMVDDIAWIVGEEPEDDLAPDFKPIPEE